MAGKEEEAEEEEDEKEPEEEEKEEKEEREEEEEKMANYTLNVECKLVQQLWRSVWKFLEKLNNRTTQPLAPGESTPNTMHQVRVEISTHSCLSLHPAQQPRAQPRCPLVGEWVKMV